MQLDLKAKEIATILFPTLRPTYITSKCQYNQYYYMLACGHVDVGRYPHKVLAATLTLFRPVLKAIDVSESICVLCSFDVSSDLLQNYLMIRQLCSLRQNLFGNEHRTVIIIN